jgi:hypothetical protein
MLNIDINPANYENQYLDSLNECFNGWGVMADYDWVFKREAESYSSDIMILKSEEDLLLAGSGLTYRKITSNLLKEKLDVGIMTGSWTLPTARGKGCFTEIINISVDLAKQKKCEYLTAFVTKSNASYRRLESAGAKLVESAYLFSSSKVDSSPKNLAAIEIVEQSEIGKHIESLLKKRNNMMEGKLAYHYNTESFTNQYFNRKGDIQLLKFGRQYAVIEETSDKIKLHLLTYSSLDEFQFSMQSLAHWALLKKNKGIIYFSTQKRIIDSCEKMNFESVEGFYTVMQPNKKEDKLSLFDKYSIDIQMGDKM